MFLKNPGVANPKLRNEFNEVLGHLQQAKEALELMEPEHPYFVKFADAQYSTLERMVGQFDDLLNGDGEIELKGE